jgi:hypothetical protein
MLHPAEKFHGFRGDPERGCSWTRNGDAAGPGTGTQLGTRNGDAASSHRDPRRTDLLHPETLAKTWTHAGPDRLEPRWVRPSRDGRGVMSSHCTLCFGPTTPNPFGAKHQTWPHSVVHIPHDGCLAVRAAEMGDALRRSWSETFPEERRRLNRSPPTRCRSRPHLVPSGAAWPAWDSGPLLHPCHPRPVNAYTLRSGTIGAGAADGQRVGIERGAYDSCRYSSHPH